MSNFDIKEIPLGAHKRQLYGNYDLQLLISRFCVTSTSAEQVLKVQNDYQILKDRMVMPKFEFCKDAGELCSKIARDTIFPEIVPELNWLCCITLLIPSATAWPEKGFSTFCRVKNKQRNRLIDPSLNALIFQLMAHPLQLTDKNAKAEKWENTKKRRQVTERAVNMVKFEDLAVSDDDGSMESVPFDNVETEKFLL